MDAAQDRLDESGRAEHVAAVEAARLGFIFGHDQKQYAKWRLASEVGTGASQRGLDDLARDFGGSVSRGGFEFRH
jgi:hypothetical protein